MNLLSAHTTNTAGTAKVVRKGGTAQVVYWGTFGAGTVALEYSPDGGTTWISLDTATANGVASVVIPAGQVRGSVSGGTSASLNLSVTGVEFTL